MHTEAVRLPIQFKIEPDKKQADQIQATKKLLEEKISRLPVKTEKEREEAQSSQRLADKNVTNATMFSVVIKKEPKEVEATPSTTVVVKEEETEIVKNATPSSATATAVIKEEETETVKSTTLPSVTANATVKEEKEEETEIVKSTTLPSVTADVNEETIEKKTILQNVRQYATKENLVTASKVGLITAAGFHSPMYLFAFAVANTISNRLAPKLAIFSAKEVAVGNALGSVAYVAYDPQAAYADLSRFGTAAAMASTHLPQIIEKGAAYVGYGVNVTGTL